MNKKSGKRFWGAFRWGLLVLLLFCVIHAFFLGIPQINLLTTYHEINLDTARIRWYKKSILGFQIGKKHCTNSIFTPHMVNDGKNDDKDSPGDWLLVYQHHYRYPYDVLKWHWGTIPRERMIVLPDLHYTKIYWQADDVPIAIRKKQARKYMDLLRKDPRGNEANYYLSRIRKCNRKIQKMRR